MSGSKPGTKWYSTPNDERNRPMVAGSVRRAVADAFRKKARALKMTISDALEEALELWLRAKGVDVPKDEGPEGPKGA